MYPDKIVVATDSSTYAVVYECSLYIPHVLNMRADQLSIYTKSETPLDDAQLQTIENAVRPLMPDVWDRLQDLKIKNCAPQSIWSQLVALATDPESYFSQW